MRLQSCFLQADRLLLSRGIEAALCIPSEAKFAVLCFPFSSSGILRLQCLGNGARKGLSRIAPAEASVKNFNVAAETEAMQTQLEPRNVPT